MNQTNEALVNLSSSFAELIDGQTIFVMFNARIQKDELLVKIGERPIAIKQISQSEKGWLIHLEETYPYGNPCVVQLEHVTLPIRIDHVTRTQEFAEQYRYDGFLGADYSKTQTRFFVWAPTAIGLTLNVFDHWYDNKHTSVPFSRLENGVWEATLLGDQEGKWYTFHAEHGTVCHCHVVDPYARFLSVNGEKAMVGNIEKTDLFRRVKNRKSKKSPVVYEMHVRDFTSHYRSLVTNKGTFDGIRQSRDRFIQLKELGVTHIQWLPIQDFTRLNEAKREEQYNWGYDTTHFFGIEGSYSTNPYCGYRRVIECKEAVQTIKECGLNLILDVVYNHLYKQAESAVERLVPGYFFRKWPNGELGNGTGVGNEFASEQPMARKLILDSVKWWLDEFEFDGLRFDLMGSLDVETMKEIQKYASGIERPILLYGEGWELSSPLEERQRATSRKNKELSNIGFFQDGFRDAVRGSTFDLTDLGFGSPLFHRMSDLKKGIYDPFLSPFQLIQYIEAHDNETLFDKLKASCKGESDRLIKRRHRLATSILLLAQGIPFLHAGQERYRTKWGERDSYLSPDWVNQLKWHGDKDRAYFQYIKGLIDIRQAFHLSRNDGNFYWLVEEKQVLAYERHVVVKGIPNRVVVIHNGSTSVYNLAKKYTGSLKNVVDDSNASLVPLYSSIGERLAAKPLSTSVYVQNL